MKYGSVRLMMKSLRCEPYWMRVRNFCPPPVNAFFFFSPLAVLPGQLNKSKFPCVSSTNPSRLSTELKPAPKLNEPVCFSATSTFRSRRPGTEMSGSAGRTSVREKYCRLSRRARLASMRTVLKRSPGASASSRRITLSFVFVLPAMFTLST